MYRSKAFTGQVSLYDRAIAIYTPTRNWSVLEDSKNMDTQVGKNLMSQALQVHNSLKTEKKPA